MGLIWNKMRHANVPGHALMLQEVKGALSRSWPIVWHFGQFWRMLRVSDAESPYYLYRCIEGERVTRYHFLIHTPYVLVQVGPEKLYFWAETRTHQQLLLEPVDIKMADILAFPKSVDIYKKLKQYRFTKV